MKKEILFTVAVLSCLLVRAGISEPGPAAVPSVFGNGIDFKGMAGLQRDALEQELEKIDQDQEALATQLIVQVRNPSSNEAKLAAIYLLGRFRMEQGVPALVANIDFHDESVRGVHINAIPLLGEWPAVDALIRIGGRADSEMIRLLATNDDVKVRQLSMLVLRDTLGPILAKQQLLDAIDHTARDASERARLKQAMELIGKPIMPN
jgi:hypothetical protein